MLLNENHTVTDAKALSGSKHIYEEINSRVSLWAV
jgi:hypothetical protein